MVQVGDQIKIFSNEWESDSFGTVHHVDVDWGLFRGEIYVGQHQFFVLNLEDEGEKWEIIEKTETPYTDRARQEVEEKRHKQGEHLQNVFLQSMINEGFAPELNNNNKSNFMSVIKQTFKSKEDKAMEYFDLGDSKNLSGEGRAEFLVYLYETMDEERKGFLKKIVEAYKENNK